MKVPRGSEKGKSSNDDGHGHGQKKRRPSTNVEGKNNTIKNAALLWGQVSSFGQMLNTK